MEKGCRVDDCRRMHYAKGCCLKHYRQFERHGRILERTIYDRNEIIIEGDIAYIQLYDTHCKPIKKAIIDKEDIDKCKQYKWGITGRYVLSVIKGKGILLHNFVLNRKASHKIQVDHRNQIKHDCRKSNLRLCTPNQNKYNACLISTNTSGFKGVYFSKQTKKWVAEIKANKTKYNLGYFFDKIKAAKARDKAAIKMHGEFAVLNFPNEV